VFSENCKIGEEMGREIFIIVVKKVGKKFGKLKNFL